MQKCFLALIITATGLCPIILSSCSTCSRKPEVKVEVDGMAADTAYVKMAEKVFYSLPTPIEMSVLIKNLGIQYQASLLNDPLNASKYLTNSKMAVNFGVYVTDLVYAGLFNQTQVMLRYKLSIQKMIDGLGMTAAVDNKMLKSLEANINNKEEMLRILSDTYSSCSEFLNQGDRDFLTVSSLIGGWVEGMYIASSMTNENLSSAEQQIEQLVIDQKLTFDMLWQVLNDVRDKPGISDLMSELSGLAAAFDKVQVEQTDNTVEFDKETNTSVIRSVSMSTANAEAFTEIKQQIQTIRHNFVR